MKNGDIAAYHRHLAEKYCGEGWVPLWRTGSISSSSNHVAHALQHYAGQNQFKLHLAVTWVAIRAGDILGYATVAGSSIERERLPDAAFRQRFPAYPLPVLRLARLAVDRHAQGLGLGSALVRHVLELALAQRDIIGCVGVVTDAKSGSVPFYESLGFIPLDNVREGLLHGEPLPMWLNIRTIAAAVGSVHSLELG